MSTRLARLCALQGETWEAHELFAEGVNVLVRQGESGKAKRVRAMGRAWTRKRSWSVSTKLLSLRGRSH